MSTPGFDRPGIPQAEFVPRPNARADYGAAQWGIAVRVINGQELTTETFEPADVSVSGVPIEWFPDRGGILLGVVRHPFLGRVAIARAVPLS